jgi:hypothetical protein
VGASCGLYTKQGCKVSKVWHRRRGREGDEVVDLEEMAREDAGAVGM